MGGGSNSYKSTHFLVKYTFFFESVNDKRAEVTCSYLYVICGQKSLQSVVEVAESVKVLPFGKW